ncbi:hypothetical protein GALMADRAFT_139567 [Galerina marginata CBS 339.88]|uniref:Fungal-type protein kinase domain-containing protein n=1 Tax=Galerina marginata (strain CBS 339.88) TaxID=685588 RepID=A0A067T0J5_GALM3|nr:hypothetical protein GALMADRAFT_139567 [Galerina marginata CBS 339.88]
MTHHLTSMTDSLDTETISAVGEGLRYKARWISPPLWTLDPAFSIFRQTFASPMPDRKEMDAQCIMAEMLATKIVGQLGRARYANGSLRSALRRVLDDNPFPDLIYEEDATLGIDFTLSHNNTILVLGQTLEKDAKDPLSQLRQGYLSLVCSQNKSIFPGQPVFLFVIAGGALELRGAFYDGTRAIFEPMSLTLLGSSDLQIEDPFARSLYALMSALNDLIRRSGLATAKSTAKDGSPNLEKLEDIYQNFNKLPVIAGCPRTFTQFEPFNVEFMPLYVNFVTRLFFFGRDDQVICKVTLESDPHTLLQVECNGFRLEYGLAVHLDLMSLPIPLAPIIHGHCKQPLGSAFLVEYLGPPTNAEPGWMSLFDLATQCKEQALLHLILIKDGLRHLLDTLVNMKAVHGDFRSHNVVIFMTNIHTVDLVSEKVRLMLTNFHRSGLVGEAHHGMDIVSSSWSVLAGKAMKCEDDLKMYEQWIDQYPNFVC